MNSHLMSPPEMVPLSPDSLVGRVGTECRCYNQKAHQDDDDDDVPPVADENNPNSSSSYGHYDASFWGNQGMHIQATTECDHHNLSVDPWGRYGHNCDPPYNSYQPNEHHGDNHLHGQHGSMHPSQYHQTFCSTSHECIMSTSEYECHHFDAYTARDVLCGRGALMAWHSGNKAFRELIKQHREMYLLARRRDKPRIANYIIEVITSSGGRFLREMDNPNGGDMSVWVEIESIKAYEKTTQALREGAPKMRQQWREALAIRGSDVSSSYGKREA